MTTDRLIRASNRKKKNNNRIQHWGNEIWWIRLNICIFFVFPWAHEWQKIKTLPNRNINHTQHTTQTNCSPFLNSKNVIHSQFIIEFSKWNIREREQPYIVRCTGAIHEYRYGIRKNERKKKRAHKTVFQGYFQRFLLFTHDSHSVHSFFFFVFSCWFSIHFNEMFSFHYKFQLFRDGHKLFFTHSFIKQIWNILRLTLPDFHIRVGVI